MIKETGKIRQDRVMTAIEGSYPKPKYLFAGSGRELLDNFGAKFYDVEKEIGVSEFKNLSDKAVLMAIEDQNAAGIDLVTDGEERRGHYVLHVLKKLSGIDFKCLRKKSIRGGIYVRHLPAVVERIAYKGDILLDDYRFAVKHANGIVKVSIPGPSTVVDCVADEFYNGNHESMAMDYAGAIHHEIEELIKLGCRVVQIDDPVLIRYIEQTEAWGLKALQVCFQGLEDKATFIVHVCCGYPDKEMESKGVSYKANHNYYKDILSWMSDTTIDIISIEGAQSNLDLSILPAVGNKSVMLGVLDVGSDDVESVESIVNRGKEALRYLPKEKLILAPDCGMLQLSRTVARKKLENIVTAASVLNR
ncbi:MAG: hypothetical protein ACUZ8H_12925 [Candidatus Anammoxibacter sp.]